MGHYRPLSLYFHLFSIFNVQLVDKILPMTGFKLRIFGVGSERSANWATTTTLNIKEHYFSHSHGVAWIFLVSSFYILHGNLRECQLTHLVSFLPAPLRRNVFLTKFGCIRNVRWLQLLRIETCLVLFDKKYLKVAKNAADYYLVLVMQSTIDGGGLYHQMMFFSSRNECDNTYNVLCRCPLTDFSTRSTSSRRWKAEHRPCTRSCWQKRSNLRPRSSKDRRGSTGSKVRLILSCQGCDDRSPEKACPCSIPQNLLYICNRM